VTQSSSYDAKLGLSFGRTDSGVGGGERAAFLGKAVPASTPWTATAKLKIPAGIITPHINTGMSLYNSGSSKLIVFGNQNLAGVIKSFVTYFTNLNTFNADIKVLTISAQQLPEWFRIASMAPPTRFRFPMTTASPGTRLPPRSRPRFSPPTRSGLRSRPLIPSPTSSPRCWSSIGMIPTCRSFIAARLRAAPTPV
jgi:hypothetical protein